MRRLSTTMLTLTDLLSRSRRFGIRDYPARVRTRRQRRRAVWLIVVGVSAAGLAVLAHATHVTRRSELASVDARFSVRGARHPPSDVALVGIDARTIATLHRPPLPRRLDARVIDALRRDGARVIALDLEITSPTDDADDRALFNAIRRAGNVVMATSIVNPGGTTPVLGNAATLRAARAVAGSTSFHARGGVFRQVPYEFQGPAVLRGRRGPPRGSRRRSAGVFR